MADGSRAFRALRSWAVEVDASRGDAIEQVRTWHDSGSRSGADARGLTLSPDAAAYARWFGPTPAGDHALLPREEADILWNGLLTGSDGCARCYAVPASAPWCWPTGPSYLLRARW
ncbi:MAG: hypothetical protein U0736_05810 [Gemmataceae bacterium]